ncbi:hypothetical protein [Streptomyces sp. NBRC 109706]|uniref:hypothetical protein n=1 Tax=Streptomyces sp. NBRC 109706 TaxID=1550035 RepID=UPI0007857808|nr:hypothetical protein [Streptomyces sp. NBRC 109706]
MATSAVPDALGALVEILRAAPGLSGVVVHDGYPGADLEDPDVLVVGWSPENDTAVEMRQDFNAAGARTRDEDFDVLCWLQSWSGDGDAGALGERRARAFGLLAEVENALRATNEAPMAPTLNGTVLWAHLTAGQVQQTRGSDGATVSVAFRVSCRARI